MSALIEDPSRVAPLMTGQDGTTPTGTKGSARLAYSPSLDQLRGVLIIWMMLYHGDVAWAKSGFLGVETFFVLSGFLITALMLRERRVTDQVDLGQFWARRARRLLPAMWATVIAVVVVAAITGLTSMAAVRSESLGTLLYYNNWRQVVTEQSYFAAFTEAPLLRHTWSLAIEEQFYLVWPPLLFVILWATGGRRRAVVAAIAGALAVAVLWSQVAATLSDDVNRLYQGSDTRLPGLLIGCLVAALLEGGRFRRRTIRLIRWAALPAAVGCALAILTLGETDRFTYHGGLLLFDVAVVALLPAMVSGARKPAWASATGLAPARAAGRGLRRLGIVSYGLYLVHWPVFLVLSERRTGLSGPALLAVRFGVAIVVAEACYRLIETPIRSARWSARTTLSAAGVGTALLVAAVLALPQTTDSAGGTQSLQEQAADRGFEIVDGVLVPVGDGGEPAPSTAPTTPDVAAPERDLVVGIAGDSMAASLAWSHVEAVHTERITGSVTADAALIGCGLVIGQAVTGGRHYGVQDGYCDTWRQRWADMVAQSDPDITLVVLGAWETLDWEVDGVLYESGTPEHSAMVEGLLREGIDLLTARGGKVALASWPCTDSPDAVLYPGALEERVDPELVAGFNGTLERIATERPDVEYIDVRSVECPDGVYDNEMDGVPLFTDGLHYSQEGAEVVWAWMLPQLEQMARPRG